MADLMRQALAKQQALLNTMHNSAAYQTASAAQEANPFSVSKAHATLLAQAEKQEQKVIELTLQLQRETQQAPAGAAPAPGPSTGATAPTATATTAAPSLPLNDNAKYPLPGYNSDFTLAADGKVNHSAKSQHEQLCVLAEPMLGGIKRTLAEASDTESASSLAKKIQPIIEKGEALFTEHAKFLTLAGKEGFDFATYAKGNSKWHGFTAEDDKLYRQAKSEYSTMRKNSGSELTGAARKQARPASNPAQSSAPLVQMVPMSAMPLQFTTSGTTQMPGMSQVTAGAKVGLGGQSMGKGAGKASCYRCGALDHFVANCPKPPPA